MQIQEISTPAIIVEKSRLLQNIDNMARKAKRYNVALRPHIKTHKCIEIAELQRKAGIEGITVATLSEAQVFSNYGFGDITYAVPLSFSKIKLAAKINEQIDLNILVDSPHILNRLSEAVSETRKDIGILVKVDCGYHRVGVNPSKLESIKIVERIRNLKGLNFNGILTHAGHSYSAKSASEIRSIANQEQNVMVEFATKLRETDESLIPDTISIGSTPTTMLSKAIRPEITEIRPGSYVYFDYTQLRLGTCTLEDCSFSLLTSIVSKHNDRLVTDAGATALSKDVGPIHLEPDCGFGKFYANYDLGELDLESTLTSLSQEHGKVKFNNDSFLKDTSLEDKLRILPNHSCLTNNLFDEIYVVDNERVVDKWRIHRGFNIS